MLPRQPGRAFKDTIPMAGLAARRLVVAHDTCHVA